MWLTGHSWSTPALSDAVRSYSAARFKSFLGALKKLFLATIRNIAAYRYRGKSNDGVFESAHLCTRPTPLCSAYCHTWLHHDCRERLERYYTATVPYLSYCHCVSACWGSSLGDEMGGAQAAGAGFATPTFSCATNTNRQSNLGNL